MTEKIFISYRRNDSSGIAGRIYDHLVKHYPRQNIFFDVDNVFPGENFEQEIIKAVSSCTTMLVVIGSKWEVKNGKEIYSEIYQRDWIRFEIELAIKNNLRIIPILLEGALMPKPSEIPKELEQLTFISAIAIRHISFFSDFKRLLTSIKYKERTQRKNPFYLKHLPFIIAIVLSICAIYFIYSKKNFEKDAVTTALEKEYNSPRYKTFLAFSGESGSFKIDKMNQFNDESKSPLIDSVQKRIGEFLSKLQLMGYVIFNTVDNYHYFNGVYTKIYLTDKGREILLYESDKSYYLKTFDFSGFKIVERIQKGDTIDVAYQINEISNKTPIYEMLDERSKRAINGGLGFIERASFLKTDTGLSLIEGVSTDIGRVVENDKN